MPHICCCNGVTAARRPALLLAPLAAAGLWFSAVCAGEAAPTDKWPPPKFRVALYAVPADAAQARSNAAVQVTLNQSEPFRTLLISEGVVITEASWMQAHDLVVSGLTTSGTLRLFLDLSGTGRAADGAANAAGTLLLAARFGVSLTGARASLLLVAGDTGAALASVEGTGGDMATAVRQALAGIERKVETLSWRARIVGVRDNRMLVEAGKLDGLVAGQIFVGWSLAGKPAGTDSLSERALLLHGKRTGLYRVEEPAQDCAFFVPVDNAPLLAAGDVVESPPLSLPARPESSRTRRAWDRLYEGQ